ncbi:type IX secretion system membrane protein PorP/SprF, partial [Pedobacter sp. Hv1]
NQSATFGLGLDIKKRYLVSGMYTTQTSELSGYTNGSFELNLRVNLAK